MPPSRVRYAAYYRLWTTICLFDRPEVFGKAKRRADTSDRVASSVFEAIKVDYRKNVMAGMQWTNEWVRDAATRNQEFLFLIERAQAELTRYPPSALI